MSNFLLQVHILQEINIDDTLDFRRIFTTVSKNIFICVHFKIYHLEFYLIDLKTQYGVIFLIIKYVKCIPFIGKCIVSSIY